MTVVHILHWVPGDIQTKEGIVGTAETLLDGAVKDEGIQVAQFELITSIEDDCFEEANVEVFQDGNAQMVTGNVLPSAHIIS